jgi:hypothetical protein
VEDRPTTQVLPSDSLDDSSVSSPPFSSLLFIVHGWNDEVYIWKGANFSPLHSSPLSSLFSPLPLTLPSLSNYILTRFLSKEIEKIWNNQLNTTEGTKVLLFVYESLDDKATMEGVAENLHLFVQRQLKEQHLANSKTLITEINFLVYSTGSLIFRYRFLLVLSFSFLVLLLVLVFVLRSRSPSCSYFLSFFFLVPFPCFRYMIAKYYLGFYRGFLKRVVMLAPANYGSPFATKAMTPWGILFTGEKKSKTRLLHIGKVGYHKRKCKR